MSPPGRPLVKASSPALWGTKMRNKVDGTGPWEETDRRTRIQWVVVATLLLCVHLGVSGLAAWHGMMLLGIGGPVIAVGGYLLFLRYVVYAKR